MPLYEYSCENCGFQFEALRPMKDADTPIECKNCHSQQTHKMLSVFFAKGDGQTSYSSGSSGCAGCSGGSCTSCHH